MESWIFAAGLMSLALGGAMTLLAWNVMRQNRHREAARTALLSQLAFPAGLPAEGITDPPADGGERFGVDEFRRESSASAEPTADGRRFERSRSAQPSPVPIETLFSKPEVSGAASRRVAALAAVSVAFVIVIGAYWWFASAGTSPTAATSAAPSSDAVVPATTVPVPAPVPAPVQPAPSVELVSLTHRATPDAFLVTGQVHNPAGGAPLHDVVAVVEVMDHAGHVLMTVRAPLERRELNAGEDAEFSAAASKATGIAEYRVTFQDTARVVIPHVDRREKAVNSHV